MTNMTADGSKTEKCGGDRHAPSPQHIPRTAGRSFSSASLFLPAAGNCNGGSRNNAGTNGNYWSRSLNESTPQNAWRLNFNSGSRNVNGNNRRYGFSVRPVLAVPL